MKALLSVLLLCATAGADDFRWQVTDAPYFSWTITVKGGDPPEAKSKEPEASPQEKPSLKSAIAAYRAAGGNRAYVRGKTDWQHLVDDHGWSASQLQGLSLDELQFLHGASHAGKLDSTMFGAVTPDAPFTPAAASLPAAPSADTKPPGKTVKPAITIAVAPFYCAPCNQLKAMDWSGFDVTWVTGGNVRAFPEISWNDKRGVKRVLTGAYSPWQVRWSWSRTQ